ARLPAVARAVAAAVRRCASRGPRGRRRRRPEWLRATDARRHRHRRGRYRLSRSLTIEPGGQTEAAFFLAAGPEQDGACATVGVLRRRGWREALGGTRDALRALE